MPALHRAAPVLRASRILRTLAPAAAMFALVACAAPADRGATAAEDIVNVPQTSLKNQSISNCWIYATFGWAESLHAATGQPELNLSESYLSYWHWFDQLVWDGAPGKTAIDETGYFKGALDLVARFGIVSEADFIPEEATAETSRRQASAKAKMDRSMKDGALATAEARKDKALVRRELNAAWGLGDDVIATMNALFGEGYDRSLDQPSTILPEGTFIRRAADIDVLLADGTSAEPRRGTLADAIGVRAFEQGWGRRGGPHAWNEWDYPADPVARRTFEIRIQRALHARQPVVISWMIDFAALGNNGELRAPPARPGRQGGHVTVLEDYEITGVPGFGTLRAGVLEERPEALSAALDPSASITFFRTKNSWGDRGGPAPEFRGYLDLYTAYLHGPVQKCDTPEGGGAPVCVDDHQPLWRVGLPAGF